MSDKIDVEINTMIRDKQGHYIMIEGSTQEEDITIINIYVPYISCLQETHLKTRDTSRLKLKG